MLNGSSTLNAQTQAILLGQLALQMQAAQTLSATSTALTVTSGFSFEQQTAILEALQHRLAELERQAVLAHKHQAAQSKWQDLGHSLLVKARSITGKKLRNWRTLGLKAQQILEQKAEILADADAYPAGAEVTIGGKTLWVVRNAGKAPSFSATPELPLSPVGEDDRHREGDRFSSVVDPTATPSIGGVRPLPGSATPKPTPQRHGGLGSPVPGLQFHTPGAVSTPGSVLKTPTTPFSADEEKTTVWVKLDKASGIKEIKGVKTVKTADELPERGWKNQVVIVPHESDPDNDCYRWSSSSRKWYKLNPNQWDFSEDFWSPAAQEDA